MIVLRAMAHDVRSHLRDRRAEFCMTAVMLGVAVQLLRNPHTLEMGHVYTVLRWLGDEALWGSCAVALGIARLIALLLNGTFPVFRRISPFVRFGAAFFSVIYWAMIGAGIALENQYAFIIPMVILFVGLEIYLSITIAGETGRNERRARDASAGR